MLQTNAIKKKVHCIFNFCFKSRSLWDDVGKHRAFRPATDDSIRFCPAHSL